VNFIDFFMDYNDAASAEGKALHPFWNYMSVPWEKGVFNTKIFLIAVAIQNLITYKLRGYFFCDKERDLFLKRVVFTMATVSLIIS